MKTKDMDKKIAVCYIPIIHRGYLNFIHSCEIAGVSKLLLLDLAVLQEEEKFTYLVRKNSLYALPVEDIKKALSQYTDIQVDVLDQVTLHQVMASKDINEILMPKEDVSLFLKERYFTNHTVTYENVFLRWNRENIGETKAPEVLAIDLPEFITTLFHLVLAEATKSADWWRNVGAALVKNEKVIALAHNEHMPHEQLPNIYGDTRALFNKGVNIHYVTAAHAEVGVIAEAARNGISTEGAELFLTDFPCPYCARLIAKAGIKKIYFLKGYAVLEGDEFLKSEGIELVQVGLTR